MRTYFTILLGLDREQPAATCLAGLVGRPADPARCAELAREFNHRVEGFGE